MSNNGKNTNDELYNVTTGVFSDWNIVNAGNAKDAVWAPLGITSGGVTYPMVGIDENSANTVLYAISGNTATLATTLTDLNGNSMSWDTSKGMGSWWFVRFYECQRTNLLLLPQRRPVVRMGTDVGLNRSTNADRLVNPK